MYMEVISELVIASQWCCEREGFIFIVAIDFLFAHWLIHWEDFGDK